MMCQLSLDRANLSKIQSFTLPYAFEPESADSVQYPLTCLMRLSVLLSEDFLASAPFDLRYDESCEGDQSL